MTKTSTPRRKKPSVIEQWLFRRDRFDEEGGLISRYLLTTVGRVVINHTILDAVAAS